MIIDCCSDLHGFYPKLEGGDLLIVAGDLTTSDKPFQYGEFGAWLDRQKYRKKILVAGNHENYFQKEGYESIRDIYSDIGVEYLCDSGTEFEYNDEDLEYSEYYSIELGYTYSDFLESTKKKVKIYGSPWTKTFPGMNPHCKAFTVDTEEELIEKFEIIPRDTDILITHSPPYSILDKTTCGKNVGSKYLFTWLKYGCRPRLHVFGHIHEAYGQEEIFPGHNDTMVKSVNCSHVNERYQPVNKPIRIEI